EALTLPFASSEFRALAPELFGSANQSHAADLRKMKRDLCLGLKQRRIHEGRLLASYERLAELSVESNSLLVEQWIHKRIRERLRSNHLIVEQLLAQNWIEPGVDPCVRESDKRVQLSLP